MGRFTLSLKLDTGAKYTVISAGMLDDFYFYLVIENKRDIASLGFDFIDHCGGSINIHDSIIINEFDDSSYAIGNKAIECDALISLIDSLSEY